MTAAGMCPSCGEDTAPVPTHAYYSPGQVAWASFLGAPIAGCLLMAGNYSKAGQSSSAVKTVAIGGACTIAILVMAIFLPDKFPNAIIPAAYTFGMLAIAKSLQGKALESHLRAGGPKASSWVATGIGVLSLVIVAVLIFAMAFVAVQFFPDSFPDE